MGLEHVADFWVIQPSTENQGFNISGPFEAGHVEAEAKALFNLRPRPTVITREVSEVVAQVIIKDRD